MTTKPLVKVNPVTGTGDDLIFDLQPLNVGGFRLGARSATPIGRPTIRGFQGALEFSCATHEGSPYWIGDLMAYADSRADWKEKLSQAMAVTGLAAHTLKNLGYVSRHVEEPERKLAPSPAHAAEVASLPRPEQTKFLAKAREEGLTVKELRQEIKAAARRTIIDGQADEMYTVDVTVRVAVEAGSKTHAEDEAWKRVADGLKRGECKGHVIGAKAQPHVGEIKRKRAS